MKTLFRVLLILVVATLIGGLMYVGVNASGSSDTPSFEEGRRPQFDSDGENEGLRPEGGDFRTESEHEEHGESRERGGFGFPGGVIKALILMTVGGLIYSAIVWIGKKIKKKSLPS